jgi:DNA-binding MarR family transcriptional regulator
MDTPTGHTATSRLTDHTGYWLNRLRTAVHTSFERGLAEHGITVAQWNVLIALYQGDAATPLELATLIGIDTGAITRLADRLVAKELIDRATDPADRRSVTLTLTTKGRAMAPLLAAVADRNDDGFFAVLTPDQRRQFEELLGILLRAHGIDVPDQWPVHDRNISHEGGPE